MEGTWCRGGMGIPLYNVTIELVFPSTDLALVPDVIMKTVPKQIFLSPDIWDILCNGVLDMVFLYFESVNFQNFCELVVQWHRIVIFILTITRIFTSWKLENIIDQHFSFYFFDKEHISAFSCHPSRHQSWVFYYIAEKGHSHCYFPSSQSIQS